MNKILILIPYFYPGYRSGGPQQSMLNFIDAFSNRAKIYVYTQNYDLGCDTVYKDIECNIWLDFRNAKVMYSEAKHYCKRQLRLLYEEFDTIYSCGLFEINTIRLLLLHKRIGSNDKRVFVAPMGVFSEGAIAQKQIKKQSFLYLFSKWGFFSNIIWSFTSEKELLDAQRELMVNSIKNHIIAEDMPRKVIYTNDFCVSASEKNKLKVIFLARICPQKNLDYAIDILNHSYSGTIEFDIYGVIEDKKYWKQCERKIDCLPNTIIVNYKGEIKPNNVIDVFLKYDIFLFPTRGENFGHVIYEALAAGCIPIVSDTTPWNRIHNHGGKICDLNDEESFYKYLNSYLAMGKKERLAEKIKCVELAQKKYEDSMKNLERIEIMTSQREQLRD